LLEPYDPWVSAEVGQGQEDDETQDGLDRVVGGELLALRRWAHDGRSGSGQGCEGRLPPGGGGMGGVGLGATLGDGGFGSYGVKSGSAGVALHDGATSDCGAAAESGEVAGPVSEASIGIGPGSSDNASASSGVAPSCPSLVSVIGNSLSSFFMQFQSVAEQS